MMQRISKSLYFYIILLSSLGLSAQNLITNGDFESGGAGVGFQSNYILVTSNSGPRNYAIVSDPSTINSNFSNACTDHSTLGNKMMVVDGATSGANNDKIWEALTTTGGGGGIPVISGTTYKFSYWIQSISSTNTVANSANIQVKINNVDLVPSIGSTICPTSLCGWTQVTYTWAATSGFAQIWLFDRQTSPAGNDFALDDIELTAVPPPLSLTYSITNLSCINADDGSIFGYGIGGSLSYTNYTLSGPIPTVNNSTGFFTGLPPGNYTLSVTDSAGNSSSPQTGIIIPAPTGLTLTAANPTICAGASTTLTASGGGPYTWSVSPNTETVPSGANPTVSPSVTATYTVNSTTVTPNNLVYNGDFFLGNVGFTSDYTYYNPNNPTNAQKAYGVVTDAEAWEVGFATCNDHTNGLGRMMVIDGSTVNGGNDKVWCQTVPVIPGQNYTLTYWLQTLALPSPANIDVVINGVSLGTSLAPNATCTWSQQTQSWNSGLNTTAQICFYNRNIASNGNDFAIDDIAFARTNTCILPPKSVTITVTNTVNLIINTPAAVCAPNTVNITLPAVTAGSTAGLTLTYWTDAAATNSITLANASNISTSGTYYIKATLGTCSVIKPVAVTISAAGTVPLPTVVSPVFLCLGSVATPLTATPLPGATLNWYANASGGTALPGAPIPSTAVNGTVTTYYVSQTIGTCESLRVAIVVGINNISGTINMFCDPSRVTTNPVTSVFIDWNNLPPNPPIYNYSYSINGGPAVTGSTNLSSLEIFGVLPGQSATLTILSATGYPCIASSFPISNTCSNCSTLTVPTFTLPSSICSGSVAPTLPTTSTNGITGTWTPATVSNVTNNSYVFTPDPVLFPCANQYTKVITVANPPTVGTLNGNQNVCVGLTTSFSSTSSGGTWSSQNTAIATVNSANGVITGVSSGTTSIDYTIVGTGGCSNVTISRSVTVTNPVVAGTLNGNQAICISQTSTFSSTVAGGTWTSSNNAIATINAASGVINGLTAGNATMTYSVSGTGGCPIATSTRTITITALPNAGTLSGTPNVCVGLTTLFSSTSPGGTWSSANPAIATVNASTGLVTGISSGTVSIDYTVAGTGGCSPVTVSRSVTVSNPVSAGSLAGNQAICVGNITNLNSTIVGGTWSSSSNAIATVNTNSGVVTGVSAGIATMTYTVTGLGGCPNATNTIAITVTAAPNAGILSGTQAVCVGLSTTFSSTVAGGTWSTSNPAIATVSATGNIIGVAAGVATISYIVNGTGGCPASVPANRTVTVSAPQSAGTLSGTQAICVGSSTTFSSTVLGGRWESSNPTIASVNATSGLITGNATGTATIRYIITGTGGCSDTDATRTVTVNPNIVPTFNAVTPICSGNTLAPLPLTSTNGITGTWNPPLDNTNTTEYTFTPTPGLCATTTRLTITVNPRIVPLFGLFAPLCQGSTPPVLPTNSDNIPTITGTWNPPTVSTASLGTTIYTFNPTAGQCVSTTLTTLSITVVPVLTPNFQPIVPFCDGTSAPTLSNTSPNGVEGTWSPAIISNALSGNYLFTPNPDQCAVTQTLSVTIIQRTVPDFATIPPFCKGTTAPILALTSPNGITGTWSPALVDNTVSGIFPYVFTPDATECATQYTLYADVIEPANPGFPDLAFCFQNSTPPLPAISPNGILGTWLPATIDNEVSAAYEFTPDAGECALSQTITVTINQYTLIAIDGVVTNYFEENQVITVLATDSGNYLYQLDYGPLQQSNVFQNVSAGTHVIKVVDANGCSSPLTRDILVVNYPKFFTPNDDTYNDTWNISGLQEQKDAKIFIFDRYGKLIKQIYPSGQGWDGTFNGEPLPSDDYWFLVEFTENFQSKEFKAHFSLKR
jgi:gliding motility-associated-like protein